MISKRLENKVGLITGAARGMGRAIFNRLAQEGATMVLADIDVGGCETVLNDYMKENPEYKGFSTKLDIRKKDEVESCVDKVTEAFGRIDILVHCAGVLSNYPLVDLPEEDWDLVLDVNLKGTFLIMQKVGREMLKKKSGKICIIASTVSKQGAKYIGHYVASKFGVVGLVQTAAIEWARQGVYVNSICPGEVDTEMLMKSYERICELDGITMEEQVKRGKNRSLIGGLAPPEAMAPLVAFLVSSESDQIVGQSVNVDGGISFH